LSYRSSSTYFSVPLLFSEEPGTPTISPASGKNQAFELTYDRLETGNSQARLKGTFAYVPRIRFSDYRCRADVDWVELEVSLARTTQCKHVNSALKRAVDCSLHVKGLDSGAFADRNVTTDKFRVRVQDSTPVMLQGISAALRQTFGIRDPIGISGIEVAVDFYSNDRSDLKRLQMVAALFRHHLPVDVLLNHPHDDLRQVFHDSIGGRETSTMYVLPARQGRSRRYSDTETNQDEVQDRICRNHTPFQHYLDATGYRGRKGGPVMFRIQNKISDRRNPDGTVEHLPQEERRARIEVTLLNDALADFGLLSLDALSEFRFQELRPHLFNFWLPTESPIRIGNGTRPIWPPQERQPFVEGGVYALYLRKEVNRLRLDAIRREDPSVRGRSARNRRGVGKSGRELAWVEMHSHIKDALSRLSKRWQREV
jgi:hypothetical protein